MQRKHIFVIGILMLFAALRAEANSYTVKAGGGGDYSTIQSCASAMGDGDTCTVFAGTYNEVVTIPAGAAGAYNTLTVNSGDTVNVYGFVVSSHVKVIGFTITRPSSPSSNACVQIPTGTTDVYITNNTMTSCGNGSYMIQEPETPTGSSYIRIQGNSFSWGCDTASAVNACKVLMIIGDHQLIENNTATRTADFATLFATNTVFRGNIMHDVTTADCGSHSSNCHIDFIESEPEVPNSPPAYHNLYEGNIQLNNLGSNAHAYLTQADACSGQCSHVIIRYNLTAHEGSATGSSYGILDDNGGFNYVKTYNNTSAFMGVNRDATDTFASNSSYGSAKNDIYYYSGSPTLNPYAVVNGAGTGWSAGHNLAYCTSSCTLYGSTYSSGSWTSDAGNIQADPKFTNVSADDYTLQSTSPAIGAGSFLTTASNSGSASTSLTVADASYFYDGAGGLVNADWIRIGASATAQIASIDYTNNVITLASPVSWSSGAGVYLYKDSRGNIVLAGANPDMGAFPSGSTQTLVPPPPTSGTVNPPTNLKATVN